MDESDERYVEPKYDLIGNARNLRREFNISSAKKINFVLQPAGTVPEHELKVLKLLLNAEAIELGSGANLKKGTPSVSNPIGDLFLPLEGLIDIEAEKARLTKELEKTRAEIQKVEEKLSNPNFTQKVPMAVLDEHKKRLADWQAKHEAVLASLRALEN